jgi:uncharacterized protein (TIGR03000 family)
MRRTVLILGLVAASVLALTPELFAQRFGIGFGSGGVSVGTGGYGYGSGYGYGGGYGSGYYGGSGYYQPGYSGSGYYSQPGYYGSSYYSQPGYSGSNYGWGQSPSYMGSSQYYYSQPSYYSSGMVSQYPSSGYQSSYYSGSAPSEESAIFTVLVPNAEAQIFFDDAPTRQRGFERMFHSPPLPSADNLSYTVKVRWNESGKDVEQERRVQVQRGRNVVVNFRDTKTGETIPTPRSTEQQPLPKQPSTPLPKQPAQPEPIPQ